MSYFVGNREQNTFIGSYGTRSYEKNEIDNFLALYADTRNYFYRVLMNKAFYGSDEYSLYEKLFISSVAIERFIASKIDNIHNVEYFNDTDVYNFLETYGLGVLNQQKYDFSMITENFRLNINSIFQRFSSTKRIKRRYLYSYKKY